LPKLLAYKKLGDSAHGALKACGLLGREATTSFISLRRQLPGLLAVPSHYKSLRFANLQVCGMLAIFVVHLSRAGVYGRRQKKDA